MYWIHFLIHIVADQCKRFDIYHVFVFYLKQEKLILSDLILVSLIECIDQQLKVIKKRAQEEKKSSIFMTVDIFSLHQKRQSIEIDSCSFTYVYTSIMFESNTEVETRVEINGRMMRWKKVNQFFTVQRISRWNDNQRCWSWSWF